MVREAPRPLMVPMGDLVNLAFKNMSAQTLWLKAKTHDIFEKQLMPAETRKGLPIWVLFFLIKASI